MPNQWTREQPPMGRSQCLHGCLWVVSTHVDPRSLTFWPDCFPLLCQKTRTSESAVYTTASTDGKGLSLSLSCRLKTSGNRLSAILWFLRPYYGLHNSSGIVPWKKWKMKSSKGTAQVLCIFGSPSLPFGSTHFLWFHLIGLPPTASLWHLHLPR